MTADRNYGYYSMGSLYGRCLLCLPWVIFLLFSFMAKQVDKQMAKHREKITFIQSIISLIAESLKKNNRWKLKERHAKGKAKADLAIAKNKNTLRIKTTRKRKKW